MMVVFPRILSIHEGINIHAQGVCIKEMTLISGWLMLDMFLGEKFKQWLEEII